MVTLAEARKQIQTSRAALTQRTKELQAIRLRQLSRAELQARTRKDIRIRSLDAKKLERAKTEAIKELKPIEKSITQFEQKLSAAEAKNRITQEAFRRIQRKAQGKKIGLATEAVQKEFERLLRENRTLRRAVSAGAAFKISQLVGEGKLKVSQEQKLKLGIVIEGGKEIRLPESISVKGLDPIKRDPKTGQVIVTTIDGKKVIIGAGSFKVGRGTLIKEPPEIQQRREQERRTSFKELVQTGQLGAIPRKLAFIGAANFFAATDKLFSILTKTERLSEKEIARGATIIGEAGLFFSFSKAFTTGASSLQKALSKTRFDSLKKLSKANQLAKIEKKIAIQKTFKLQMKELAKLRKTVKTPAELKNFQEFTRGLLDRGIISKSKVFGQLQAQGPARIAALKSITTKKATTELLVQITAIVPQITAKQATSAFLIAQLFGQVDKLKPKTKAKIKQRFAEIGALATGFAEVAQVTAQEFGQRLKQGAGELAVLRITGVIKPKTSEATKELEKQTQPGVLVTDPFPIEVTKTKTGQKLVQRTITITVPIIKTITKGIPKVRTRIKTIPRIQKALPKFKLPPNTIIATPTSVELLNIRSEGRGVNVVVGQKLKRQKVIASNVHPFTGAKIGSRFVDRNIEASYKLIETKKKAGGKKTKPFNIGRKFRASRRNPLFIVERRKFRLDMRTERKQIKAFPIKKRKSVRKALKRK